MYGWMDVCTYVCVYMSVSMCTYVCVYVMYVVHYIPRPHSYVLPLPKTMILVFLTSVLLLVYSRVEPGFFPVNI